MEHVSFYFFTVFLLKYKNMFLSCLYSKLYVLATTEGREGETGSDDSLGELSRWNDDVDNIGDELVLHDSVRRRRRRQRRRSVYLHTHIFTRQEAAHSPSGIVQLNSRH